MLSADVVEDKLEEPLWECTVLAVERAVRVKSHRTVEYPVRDLSKFIRYEVLQ